MSTEFMKKLPKAVVNRRAEAAELLLQKISTLISGLTEMAADPQNAGAANKVKLGKENKIVFGRIQYAMPFVHSYRVVLEDGDGVIPCCRASADCGFNVGGVHDYSVLPPDTKVVVLKHHSNTYGVILCAVPELNDDGNTTFAEWISQGSGVGLFREGYYHSLLTLLSDEGGALDFSKGMPVDGTVLDWGRITALGGGIHVDPYMSYLRVDEATGLSVFYHDQLSRLSGHNLDIWSAGYEQRNRDDRGEIQIARFVSPYYWESMGALSRSATIHKENTDEDVIFEGHSAKLSPAEDDLMPFYRFREEIGYLGQLYSRTVVLPPEADLNKLSSQDVLKGVFREQIMMDGTWSVETAKRAIISKRSRIPVPKQLKLAEDYSESADTSGNYRPAGQAEPGSSQQPSQAAQDNHKVGDIKYAGQNGNIIHVANSMDTESYVFNWQGIHPYHYHTKDYLLPQERELGKVQPPRDFSELQDQPFLSEPESELIKVDERYGETKYFDVSSAITLTEDGGWIIRGGGGEVIQAVAGNIIIDCPGNIFLRCGKSLINLSGDDTVIRAKNSVDISATDKDVSIKAENNLRMLSHVGGMLFDCRSSGDEQEYSDTAVGEDVRSTGIIFKSANSPVVAMASDIYLRTGSSDGRVRSGSIVLDADKGNNDIKFIARDHVRHIGNIAKDCFGLPTPTDTNVYSASSSLLGTPVDVNGQFRVNGPVSALGNVSSAGGTFLAAQAGDGKIRTMSRPSQESTRLQQINDAAIEQLVKGFETFQTDIKEKYHDSGKLGSPEAQQDISFSFRNEEQYGTSNFKMLQPLWQVMAPNIGVTWNERAVKFRDKDELMPWPGKKKWTEDAALLKIKLSFFDPQEGNSKDRDESIYENPEYSDLEDAVAEDSYKILGG